MQNSILILCLLIASSSIRCQDVNSSTLQKNRLSIQYYPSALIAGDIAFGLEHRYKQKLAHELSFSLKAFKPKIYNYNKGFRIDYLVKYYLINKNRFSLSANLSFEYKNIHYSNEKIEYYYINGLGGKDLYLILREDKRLSAFGAGPSFSMNFKLHEKIFIGTDAGINFIKYKITKHVREVLYYDSLYPLRVQTIAPLSPVSKNSRLDPSLFLRIKISYRF